MVRSSKASLSCEGAHYFSRLKNNKNKFSPLPLLSHHFFPSWQPHQRTHQFGLHFFHSANQKHTLATGPLIFLSLSSIFSSLQSYSRYHARDRLLVLSHLSPPFSFHWRQVDNNTPSLPAQVLPGPPR